MGITPGGGPSVRWVTSVPPDHHGGGGHRRQAHLIDALAERATIELVCVGEGTGERVRAAATSVVEVENADRVRGSTVRRVGDLWWATGVRGPREVAAHRRARRSIRDLWAGLGPADVVVVDYAAMAPLVRLRRPGERWFLTLHNTGSGMARQRAAVAPTGRVRWIEQRDARSWTRFERTIPADYDDVFVPSSEDARALGIPAKVVPNGVDLDEFRPSPLPPSPVVILSGAMYTQPNIDAARWFAGEIFPKVRDRVADAEFHIVGMRPVDSVLSLADYPGVHVHADVPNAAAALARARVACVPIRIGTGTRLKALEAMAGGRPVVGTSVGMEGLGVRDGDQAVIRDHPDDFADAVVGLLTDDEDALRLVERGLEHVSRFSWPVIGEEFRRLVLDDADSAGSGAAVEAVDP